MIRAGKYMIAWKELKMLYKIKLGKQLNEVRVKRATTKHVMLKENLKYESQVKTAR